MNEIWKDVENTSGRYQISSEGRLRKKDHDDYVLVRPRYDRDGYQYVEIFFDDIGKNKHISIHRLVAITFINNPYNLPIVHHIDDNKQNNSATNLFWCTHAQNLSFRLSARNGKYNKHREIEQYTLDGKYIATWSSYSEAYRAVSPKNNCKSSGLISECCRGVKGKKQAYGFIWRFGKGDPMYKPSIDASTDNINGLFRMAYEKSPERVKNALLEIIGE